MGGPNSMTPYNYILLSLLGTSFLIVLIALMYQIFYRKKNNAEAQMLDYVFQTLSKVSDGQQQLVGSLKNISETHSTTQAEMVKHVESRLTEVQGD